MQISFDKDKGQYYALDMNSKHGVYINGSKIDNQTSLADCDQIHIGQTDLLFTEKDFADPESALSHLKKVGERIRPTIID
jgi:pSer/pThr/pTyr-binding forkhead associated (FHA) protein